MVVAGEGCDTVWEGINGISVVKWLSTESAVQGRAKKERGTVVHVLVWLNDEDKLLTRVVEVQLDLVTGRSDRLVTSELKLLNQVLMWVLGHAATLIRIKEDVIDVERSGNQRLLVGSGILHRGSVARLTPILAGYGARLMKSLLLNIIQCNSIANTLTLRVSLGKSIVVRSSRHRADGPQDLIQRTEFKVDLDLVVLESNEGQSKPWVTAEPELKRDVKRSLRKCVTRGAHSGGDISSSTSRFNIREGWIDHVGQLRGLSDHRIVTTLLLGSQCKLLPNVHPVTILAIDALTSDLDLNHRDKLLTWVVQPTSIGLLAIDWRAASILADLWKSDLKVGAVGKITITRNGTLHTATEVGLSVEGLFNGLHGKVGVTAVSNLPECDLGVTREVDILSAIGNELH